jgi:VCBS repeat-containing protein
VTIYNGTDSKNTINGSTGDDTIFGNGGDDRLDGRGGDDTVYGGTGDDHIEGGTGNDSLHGDADNDSVYGESGNDTLTGNDGNDLLDGGDNDDNVDGGAGMDLLYGGSGNDTLKGGGGIDLIDGGSGTDTAVYTGSIFEYEFYDFGAILGVAHNGGAGADGADLLLSVERLQFADVTIDLTQNNAPIAQDDSAATNEDAGVYSSGSASVLDNDFDFEGDTLTVTAAVIAGAYGTLTMNADGTYSYALNANAQTLAQGEVVQDSFTYTVSDGSLSDTGALVITVTGQNDGPVAAADSATTSENAAILIDVLANDDDVDNGAVLTVTAASAPAGQGTASVVGNQVEFDPGTDFDHLAVGESVVVTVDYTIQDEHGATSSSTIAVTVTGTNDGPVAVADAASTSENTAVLVDVLANDTDVDNGAVLTVTAASAPVGQGSASVVGNQVEFDPGSDFDYLAVGQSVVVTVDYTVQDEHGASSSSTIAVTVTGTNDGPLAVADAATTSENAIVLVDVLANDTDADNGAVLTVTAASAPAGQGTASVVGNQVQFDPGSDFDDLAVGQSVIVTVDYTITDEHGATSSSTIAVTVTGANDGPVAVADAASTSENAAVLVDVLANDTDVDNGAVLTVTAASAPAGQGNASVVGNQVEFDPGTDFDYLAVGETAVVTVDYSIQDENGASSSSTVTITVTGTNDAPVIDAGGTDAAGAVTELPNGDPGENVAVHTDSGTIAFDDVDASDVHNATFTPQGSGYLGTFTLDPVDQSGDSVGWDFSVSDEALDSLEEGEVVTQTYTVEISDGNGGTVTQDVTVTITGAADNLPPDGTNWYIDNSAVDSLNTGSPTDPFTSIAAFNAAQGTPGGPGAGDNVFLLAGTGTYAEADGINLMDGQTLTGVASGSVRPTIVAAAGDGVELGENNTISGIDIGSTSGAGIVDGGGTVGSLIISDVGKTGTGQILDIDEGGTLNVTLNEAASLGSAGGAIDLAGVGGSFTVSGATTITGAQSGGGIDITGSSVTATFGGGGTVSTADANAINFVGNSGALSIGGGFDIVTTSGAGLNASGGGSVTVTGAGNSIVSTTGTALTISGTTIGAAGVTLESASTSGAVNGIVLADTGAGGFTITGTGAAGSGGVIGASSGVGVSLTNTGPVSLTDFAVTGGGDDGIRGNGVNGLAMLRVEVSGNGNLTGEHGMDLIGLTGIVGIIDSSFTGNAEENIHIVNSAGTLDLTITGATIGNSVGITSDDGLIIEANGNAVVRASVTDSTFTNNRGDAFQFVAATTATSTSHITFSDNVVTTTNAAVLGGGVTITSGGAADVFTAVENNSIQGARGTALVVAMLSSTAAGEMHATITGNSIGTTGVAGSGSQTGNGMNVVLGGSGTMTVLVEDNDVFNWEQVGINVQNSGGSGRMNATIENNVVQEPGAGGALSISVVSGASSTDTGQIWLEMNGNVADTSLLNDIRLRATRSADILMPGYSGGPADTAAVDAFMTGKNPLGGEILVQAPLLNAGSGYFDTPGSTPVLLPTSPDVPFA